MLNVLHSRFEGIQDTGCIVPSDLVNDCKHLINPLQVGLLWGLDMSLPSQLLPCHVVDWAIGSTVPINLVMEGLIPTPEAEELGDQPIAESIGLVAWKRGKKWVRNSSK